MVFCADRRRDIKEMVITGVSRMMRSLNSNSGFTTHANCGLPTKFYELLVTMSANRTPLLAKDPTLSICGRIQ